MTQLPQGFLAEIAKHNELAPLASALLTEPEVSVRVNTAKVRDYRSSDQANAVPWCPEGIYLADRPQFTFDPQLHQGLYYVQDASSMAITSIIRHIVGDAPVRYLDACAAPGGKTTAALSALPHGSVVVANEYDFKRAEILAENISKWGNPNVVVSRGDTSKLGKLRSYFDIVAVDAPCSGEGMMRKEPQAVAQWSPQLVGQCAALQREILSNVWSALRPGGHLIYSTCTFNISEDEDNLAWLIDSFGAIPVEVSALSDAPGVIGGIGTTYPAYRFLPGRVRGEGLFIAVVRKPGEGHAVDIRPKTEKPRSEYKVLDRWFSLPMDYIEDKGTVYAIPRANAPFIKDVAAKLNTILTGTEAAVIKGRDILPAHQLALSTAIDTRAFGCVEVGYTDAIKYLQRDNIILPDSTPRGIVLLTYLGHPLGFVKNLGNRTNSFMPKAWRILSQNIPQSQPNILT